MNTESVMKAAKKKFNISAEYWQKHSLRHYKEVLWKLVLP